MDPKPLETLKLILAVLIAGVLAAPLAFAQTDPNPNSPTPVLLSGPDLNRAFAIRQTIGSSPNNSADLVSNLALYVMNIELLVGEGATAFRVYGEDAQGRAFGFPVRNVRMVDPKNCIYAIFVELGNEARNGKMLMSVAWRGLESNQVSLEKLLNPAMVPPTALAKDYLSAPGQTADDADYVGYRWAGDRVRFLEQATFGPTDELENRIRRIGLRTWLAEQFEAPYPSESNPYPAFSLKPTNPSIDCNGLIDNGVPDPDPFCFVNHYTMYPVQNWFYKEAIYGDAQLRHRVAWALAQLWVISGIEIQQSSHLTAYHKVLSRNAFGNWRTLMREITLNPGMGTYLNMRNSTKFNPNENFAREVLQLFNIGLFMLNQDGTLQRDATNNPIPTYGQITVNNLTATLTGWTLCESSIMQCPNRLPGSPNFIDPMIVTNPNNHDLSAKTLLNYPGSTTTANIPACSGCTGTAIATYANNSLNQALDNIYNHPNVAPFVTRFLIQQLVTGDPTPAYVGRIAAVFSSNRTNPTQLKEVVKAILLDPEARGDSKTDPRYGKLREPVQFLTNISRQFDARSADRTALSDGVFTNETAAMGQTAFMSPTVFNYYPPDYIVPGASFNGPEFGLSTTVTSVSRINFVNNFIFDRININPDRRVTLGTSVSLTELEALAESDPGGNRLMDEINRKMMHGTMRPEMRNTILNVVMTVPTSDPLLRAQRAVYLTATSSQYQVQR